MGPTYSRRLFVVLTLIGFATWLAADAGAAEAPLPRVEVRGSVDQFRGEMIVPVPIEVPAFRGLEPRLSLIYDSAGRNGFVGVGWSLSGLPLIERVNAGKGAPAYSSSDRYLLGGQELVPCVTGSVSPSCTSGGTHSTKIEDYNRIKLDAATNTWTVTAKNGTRSVLSPTFTTADGAFRWMVTSVTDTSANSVAYAWWCDGSPHKDCYPDTISYNGATIRFYRETRLATDEPRFGIGKAIGRTRYRLKAIDVTVGGSRVRAYALGYGTSEATAQSLLTSIRQYGRDAILDAAGTVTAGSSLPPITMTYSPEGTGAFAPLVTDTLRASTPSNLAGVYSGDFNGDGKEDLCAVKTYVRWYSYCWLGNGDGTFGDEVYQDLGPYEFPSNFAVITGDFNGDGKMDLGGTIIDANGWTVRVAFSNGDGTFNVSFHRIDTHNWTTPPVQLLVGNLDGDGKNDLCLTTTSGTWTTWCVLGDGAGRFGSKTSQSRGTPFSGGYGVALREFNGDGKADLECWKVDSTGWRTSVALGKGDRTFLSPVTDTIDTVAWANAWNAGAPTDLNGDGRLDACMHESDGTFDTRCSLGWGNGQFAAEDHDTLATGLPNGGGKLADFNGDGKTDVCHSKKGSTGWTTICWMGYGDGTFTAAGVTTVHDTFSYGSGWKGPVVGDFDGDGDSDLCLYSQGGTMSTRCVLTSSARPALLASLTNGMGGRTEIGYTPSSAFPSTNGPPVTHMVTAMTDSDGLGWSATTQYVYAGGLYDRVERRFLGFHYSRATITCPPEDAPCPYTETWYRQDYGTLSKPERIDRRAGDGTLLTATVNEYTTNGATVPYRSLLTGVWTYVYDGSAAPVCPGAGCKRTYLGSAYDAYGNVIQATYHGDYDLPGDERTVQTTYRTNPTAYLVSLPADAKTFAGIGVAGALLEETMSYYDGATTWDATPVRGLPTTILAWLNTTNSFVSSRTSFDAWGNAVETVDPLGATVTRTYDATYHLFPQAETNALGHVATQTWDPVCGVVTSDVDANGQATMRQHDTFCRPIREDRPGGDYTITEYVDLGVAGAQHVRTSGPGAAGAGDVWSESWLDGLGRVWRTRTRGPDAAAIVVDTVYGPRGQVERTSAPYYEGEATYFTTTEYDELDRVVRITSPDGTSVTASYTLWEATAIDQLGHARIDELDAFSRRIAHTELLAGVAWTTQYAYDERGNLVETIDPAGNVTSYQFDSLGRKLEMIDPDMGRWTYAFDAAGRIAGQTDAKGQATSFAHDALGRRTVRILADGSEHRWWYDEVTAENPFAIGRLTRVVDGTGQTARRYDAAGREIGTTRTIDGAIYAFAYEYDAAGRLLRTTYPDGDQVGVLAYDAAGRLRAIPGVVTDTSYDAVGRAIRRVQANGTITTWAHSPTRGWLDAIATSAGATPIQSSTYLRDAEGQITQVVSPFSHEGWGYAYDELHRLVNATSATDPADDQSWAYDAIGNLLHDSRLGAYVYPAPGSPRPHAVVQAGAATYDYDANGNLTAGGGRTLAWTPDNRLASVDGVSFGYDAEGSRVKKTVGGATTHYVGDDFEVDLASGSVTKYLAAAGGLVARRVDGVTEWLHTDHLGSIQVVTDDLGLVVERLAYRPYGDRLAPANPTVSRGYTGQRQDESGLFYLHARYYDPALARFVSPDPTVPADTNVGLNRYAYAANNPVSYTDSDGHNPLFIIAAVAVAVVVVAVVVAATDMAVSPQTYSTEERRAADPGLVESCVTTQESVPAGPSEGTLDRAWQEARAERQEARAMAQAWDLLVGLGGELTGVPSYDHMQDVVADAERLGQQLAQDSPLTVTDQSVTLDLAANDTYMWSGDEEAFVANPYFYHRPALTSRIFGVVYRPEMTILVSDPYTIEYECGQAIVVPSSGGGGAPAPGGGGAAPGTGGGSTAPSTPSTPAPAPSPPYRPPTPTTTPAPTYVPAPPSGGGSRFRPTPI